MTASLTRPSFSEAVLEIEAYLIEMFGRSLPEIEADLFDPTRVIEMDRALRQLETWTRLLAREPGLLSGLTWWDQCRRRWKIQLVLRQITRLQRETIQPLTRRARRYNDTRLTLASAAYIAKYLRNTMIEIRARLLSVANLVAEPFEEAIARGRVFTCDLRDRLKDLQTTPRNRTRAMKPSAWKKSQAMVYLPAFVRTSLGRLSSNAIANNATRALHFCLETLAITPTTVPEKSKSATPTRPWM